MVASYSRIYFILTQDPGDLLIVLQGNRVKSIGIPAQQRWITTQIHIFWKKHPADIIYIRRVHGCTFPSRVFWTRKYTNIYRCNIVYNGIRGGHNTYIWPRLMFWQQNGENFNKPQQISSFCHTNMWWTYLSAQATGNWRIFQNPYPNADGRIYIWIYLLVSHR